MQIVQLLISISSFDARFGNVSNYIETSRSQNFTRLKIITQTENNVTVLQRK